MLAPLRTKLPPEFRVELAGSADRLSETVGQLASAFVFSVFITYYTPGCVISFISLPLGDYGNGTNGIDRSTIKFGRCQLDS